MTAAISIETKAPQKGDPFFDLVERHDDDTGRGRGVRIRCPLCAWVPDGHPYWGCDDCGAMFDTFATGAHCPQCPKSWQVTQCISCFQLSPHDDWYTDDDDSGADPGI